MTFNGLTNSQAENSRKKYGSNRPEGEKNAAGIFSKFASRFGRIPVKIYIILILIYLAAALISEMLEIDNGLRGTFFGAVMIIPVLFILITADCFAELYFENRSLKHRRSAGDILCKVYRCGNTITELPASEIVKGDYVLLTEGDVVPAKGFVVYGDVTAVSSGSSSILVREFGEEEPDEKDVPDSHIFERGARISSGYAVIKITETLSMENLSDSNAAKEGSSKSYKASMTLSVSFAAALTLAFLICCLYGNIYGADIKDLPFALLFYASLPILTSEGLHEPLEFFRRACRSAMYRDGIKTSAVKSSPDIIFADKSAFATDGKPTVTGFTDGTGKTYSRFYEVPYPLGTLAAKAAAENTSALINRGKIIAADPYEFAEMNFISERIKNTLDLEITSKVIKGDISGKYKRLIKASPDSIIKSCTAYFDASGAEKPLSNTAALSAMAGELAFRGSNVFAYAAEDFNGKTIFIGMVTMHEKLRSSASAAYKSICVDGTKVVILAQGSSAESISIADKTVTGASGSEIISYSVLASLPADEAAKRLKTIKIITGRSDREYLTELAEMLKYTVGMTVLDYEDIEVSGEADVIYASAAGSAAAQNSADAVLSNGLMSLVKYNAYSNSIRASALFYTVMKLILLIVSALMMSAVSVGIFGSAAYYGAIILNLILTAAADVILCRSSASGGDIHIG